MSTPIVVASAKRDTTALYVENDVYLLPTFAVDAN